MKERGFFFYIFDIEIYFFHDLFKVKSLKKCVAVVLTMQLKACNPHLGFFFFDSVSLDEERDEVRCSGDRCKFIKGLESRRDSRCYFTACRT